MVCRSDWGTFLNLTKSWSHEVIKAVASFFGEELPISDQVIALGWRTIAWSSLDACYLNIEYVAPATRHPKSCRSFHHLIALYFYFFFRFIWYFTKETFKDASAVLPNYKFFKGD